MRMTIIKITTKEDVIVPAVKRQYEDLNVAIEQEMKDEEVESVTMEDEDGYRITVTREK